MRSNYITAFILLISTFSYAQFNRLLTDPILENPSYIGNVNKIRLSTNYSLDEATSKQLVSYDLPIKEQEAIGIRMAHNDLYDSRELDLTSGVSFSVENYRRRSCKYPNQFAIWSGGVSAKLNYLYHRKNYFYFTTKPGGYYAELNPYNDAINAQAYNDSLVFVGLSSPRFIIGGHAGLSRRTDKTLQETSIYYDPKARYFKHRFSTHFLLNDHAKNKLNATIGFYSELIMTGSNEIVEGFQTTFGYVTSRRVLPEKTALVGASLWINYSKLKIGFEIKDEFWTIYKDAYDQEFNSREVGDYTTENRKQFSVGYEFKRCTVLAHYTYGFAAIDIGQRWGDSIQVPNNGGTERYGEEPPNDTPHHNYFHRLSFTAYFTLNKTNKDGNF